ncbi:hypothetical protein ACEWY4_011459 [Coilia grayii]|uniref:Uncharacterized protein n=1 Tax=Coilia grayii TaxID=363190 RepID=A0ABD1K4U0_9TELE
MVYWTDCSVSMGWLMDMKRYQRINHFPRMSEICRKDLLARNLNRMQRHFPKEYNIFPKTWCLTADYIEFQGYCRMWKHKTIICKPDSGCQGKRICITRQPLSISPEEHIICQTYIAKVTAQREACASLLSTQLLTGELLWLRAWLEQNSYDTKTTWSNMEDVIIKTVIGAEPVLRQNYRMAFPGLTGPSCCFQLLGFHILLHCKLKPWFLQVNPSPSFHTESALDAEVKDTLLKDTLTLLNLGANDRRRVMEEEKRMAQQRLLQRCPSSSQRALVLSSQASWLAEVEQHKVQRSGGFYRIYSRDNQHRYSEFLQQGSSCSQETITSRAWGEQASDPTVRCPLWTDGSDAAGQRAGCPEPVAGETLKPGRGQRSAGRVAGRAEQEERQGPEWVFAGRASQPAATSCWPQLNQSAFMSTMLLASPLSWRPPSPAPLPAAPGVPPLLRRYPQLLASPLSCAATRSSWRPPSPAPLPAAPGVPPLLRRYPQLLASPLSCTATRSSCAATRSSCRLQSVLHDATNTRPRGRTQTAPAPACPDWASCRRGWWRGPHPATSPCVRSNSHCHTSRIANGQLCR